MAVFAVYQRDMEKAVPQIVEQLTGVTVSASYNVVLVVTFYLLLFYGVDAMFAQVSKKGFSRRLREHIDGAAREISGETGLSEERIKSILEKRYGKSQLRVISQAALDFFKPSKRENNAPIMIEGRNIDSETISEIPTEAEIG